jgi:replicative DNA helicase
MLRESGALEQDANKVLFLYQEKEQKESAVGEIKVKVAKNREGEKGTITLSIDKRIGVIANYETN